MAFYESCMSDDRASNTEYDPVLVAVNEFHENDNDIVLIANLLLYLQSRRICLRVVNHQA